MKTRILLALLVATLYVVHPERLASGLRSPATEPLNFVVVLTDDQRWDTLCGLPDSLQGICALPAEDHPMPTVETELMANGVVFANAVVSEPMCCPVRASFLSGGFYAHHTNVLNNFSPNGGVWAFADTSSLPVLLQQQGYKTAIIGKYLNGYTGTVDYENGTGPVPPGWDLFAVSPRQPDWNSLYEFVIGSSTSDQPGTGTLVTVTDGTYLTDYERDRALEFIDGNCQFQHCDLPFFLLLATQAPHTPATRPPRHEGLFAGFLYRGRGYDEQPDGDLSDKPLYVQNSTDTTRDAFPEAQLGSLRAVDEALAAILDNLQSKDLLGGTVVIFASDNGHLWGEHTLSGKSKPYEESIRVPLVILYPGAAPATVDRLVTVDLDVAPTIMELAAVAPIGSDGQSLTPFLVDPEAPWRPELLIQGFAEAFYTPAVGIPTWAAIRTEDNWKYVEYATGEKELYDLTTDPYELYSKHNDPAYEGVMTDLANRLALLNRGVAIRLDNLPNPQVERLPRGLVGQPYSFQFAAWGGNGEYLWSEYTDSGPCSLGSLPGGLALGTTGWLSGTPTDAGAWSFCVKVEDTSSSPQPGNDRVQSHILQLSLRIR